MNPLLPWLLLLSICVIALAVGLWRSQTKAATLQQELDARPVLESAAAGALSMLLTVEACATHACEDCREYAGLHARLLRGALGQNHRAREHSRGRHLSRATITSVGKHKPSNRELAVYLDEVSQ